jgi:16S rRNA (uracil1498-N3)-methyltransferase
MTLCQAVLKSHPMDYVIQKTSELGVAAIVPFTSERTVVRLAGDRLQNKLRHWQEIARHAATQSDRPSPAEIGPLTTFDDLLSRLGGENEMKLILWEQEGTKDLKTLLKAASPTGQVVGIVGPEGGFSREEVRRAQKAGFATASLGERVLRAETASVTLAAILQYEWGDLSLI